jgi:predicted Zn-dependent peptidase
MRMLPLAAALAATALAACTPAAGPQVPPPAGRPAVPLSATPPAPGPVVAVDFPDYHDGMLSNGARVIIVPHAEQPFVSVSLRISAGAAADPADRAGVAALTADLLTKGTAGRSAAEIAEAVDFIGASLNASAGSDGTSLGAGAVSEFIDTTLEIMADVLRNPTFPDRELETERRRLLSALQVELSQPGSLATRRFNSEIYGDHPYGRAPTPASVRAITRDDLARFHRAHYVPERALFVVAGDVDPTAFMATLERHFGDWRGAAGPAAVAPAPLPPPPPPQRRLVFVHKPGTVQAVLRAGHLLPPASDPGWVELNVMNQVLGGSYVSWLEAVIRNVRGFGYYARSAVAERVHPGYFVAVTEVRNEVADSALAEMLALVDSVRSAPPPAADLRLATDYLTGSFPLGIETPQQVASQIAGTIALGRPVSYLEAYRTRVAAVTPADVHRAASRHIDPDRMVIVVVGDAERILDRLRPFAATVHVYDEAGQPLAPESLGAPAVAPRLDPAVLAPGVQVYAIGFQGSVVGEATNTLVRETVDGRDAFRATASIMGQTQEVVFDARTFAPLRASMAGQAALEMRVEGDRVLGEFQGRAVEMAYVPGALLPGMEGLAIAAADLSGTSELRFSVLGPGGPATLTARVVGETTIDVPAGRFDVYEVEVSGANASTMHVRRQRPHLMIRQELAGQPVVLELRELR